MKFSVLTVTYNSGTKLSETVKKVLAQKYSDYEILVKDGGSKDDSLDFLRKYLEGEGFALQSRREILPKEAGKEAEDKKEAETGVKTEDKNETDGKEDKEDKEGPVGFEEIWTSEKEPTPEIRIFSEPDHGIYDAMNMAVKHSRGEYVSFMNCGDWYASDDVLSLTAAKMEETGNLEIYYGDAYFRSVGNVMHMPSKITPSVCYRHIPCHQACFFRRRLWAGKQLNPKFKIRADYEFFLYHYFAVGVQPVYLGITVADYEGGGYSESSENKKRDAYEHRVITEKYMSKKQITKEKAFRVLTLQPLRTWVAHKSPLAGAYDKLKKSIYR